MEESCTKMHEMGIDLQIFSEKFLMIFTYAKEVMIANFLSMICLK